MTGDQFGSLFGIGGSTSAAAVDIGCNVMNFIAILIGHGGVVRGAGVGTEDNAVGVDEADDGGAGLGG